MKLKPFFLIALLATISLSLRAQQYTAYDYWKMENDSVYTNLLKRQAAGESLSSEETLLITNYKTRLEEYFSKLPDAEKAFYYQNRSQWARKTPQVQMVTPPRQGEVFEGEKSLFSKYLVTSGVFGYLYGWSTIGILGIEDEGIMAGLPLLTAGASALLPLVYIKDKNVTSNSLDLAIHGKVMGAFQGAALGVLFTGEKAADNGELILGLGTLSSITMGYVGFFVGRTKPWSKGRVSLYTHYGTLMPFEALAITGAFASESPSLYAASFMAGGAAGYLLGNFVADKYDYTRGDIISTQTLTLLGAELGLGVIPESNYEDDMSSTDILLPAFGALGGSLASHLWLKNARLTNQQGRNTALAAGAGSIAGLGLMAIFKADSPNAYLLSSFAGGMTAYSIILSKYKKDNIRMQSDNFQSPKWNFNLMPQNILFNRDIAARSLAEPGKRHYMLPAFSASVTF